MVTETTNNAWSLGKWVVGGWAVSRVLDEAVGSVVNYTASGNGKLDVNSKNVGSYNSATDNSNVNVAADGTTYTDNSDNCIDCEKPEEEEGEGEVPEETMCTGPMPTLPITHTDEDGTTWVSGQCSCNSYQQQHAGCESP